MRHNMTFEQYMEELYRTVGNFEEHMSETVEWDDKKDIGEWDEIFQEFFSQSIEEM